jgi:uncharacterized protein
MVGGWQRQQAVQRGNDSQVPLEQGLLLEQRLAELNHPDHLLIAYPNLGHVFSPSNEWISSFGPASSICNS